MGTENEPKNFTFRGTRFMLTIHRHLSEDEAKQLHSLFETSKRKCKVKAFTEFGKTGHAHTHAVFLFAQRSRLESKKMWDKVRALVGKFNLKPITTDEHMAACCKYEVSEKKGGEKSESKILIDTIGDFEPEIPYHVKVIKFIQSQSSFMACLRDPEFGKYISSKLSWGQYVFAHRPRPKKLLKNLFKWQTYFDELLSLYPDDRTIHWVTDITGGRGKSKLVNHLLSKHDAFFIDDGSGKDIAYAYENEKTVLIDLCKDNEEWTPYRIMEKFKNGRMFSAKYQSVPKMFDVPHVIVFANFSPDKSRLIEDRWVEYELFGPLANGTRIRQVPNPKHHMHWQKDQAFVDLKNHLKKVDQGCPNNIKTPPGRRDDDGQKVGQLAGTDPFSISSLGHTPIPANPSGSKKLNLGLALKAEKPGSPSFSFGCKNNNVDPRQKPFFYDLSLAASFCKPVC